jgi:hypothetical protein
MSSYVIKRCPTCNKSYHEHANGKIKGACEHIRVSRIAGKKQSVATVDTAELDEMINNK